MNTENFTYSFESSLPAASVFETLTDVRKWWCGIYNESITGQSKTVGDEFTFLAGGGVHKTTQKVTAIIPDKKIAWLVTASNLSFLKKPGEWLNTKFYFEIEPSGKANKITFTHEGLRPDIECFEACSGGWMHYLKKLETTLK